MGLRTKLLKWIAHKLPTRTIDLEKQPYLTKYRIGFWKGHGLYLHQFHQGDTDRDLHNHPWAWFASLILVGGYREESFGPDTCIWSQVFKPGSINFCGAMHFHRVELLEKEAWTLLLTGPKAQSWGFKDRKTGRFTPWRVYTENRETQALRAKAFEVQWDYEKSVMAGIPASTVVRAK